ncbi:AAA family ATPase [bacterium]|nr:AAA family ATPase [bacterium]
MYKLSLINDKNPSKIDEVIGIAFDNIHTITATKNYSPFMFNDGKRNQANSNPKNLICFDIDDTLELKKAIEICSRFKSLIVTTKSHQVDKKGLICDRFRIIIPIDKDVPKEHFKSFYISLSKYLTLDNAIDTACNDVSRFFYPNINQEVYYSTSSIIISYDEVMPKLTEIVKVDNYENRELLNNELPHNFIFKDGSIFSSYEYLTINETVKIRCFNPHHEDKNPSAFISRNPNSNKLFCSCSSCSETKFIKYPNEDGIMNTHNPLSSNNIIANATAKKTEIINYSLDDEAFTIDDINALKDIEMLITGFLPKNHITLIYAPSNIGKTTSTMGVINHILQIDKSKDMTCYYLDYDNGANTMKPHLLKILKSVNNLKYISHDRTSREKLILKLQAKIRNDEDLSKSIFVFDSLQHFVDKDISSTKSEPDLKELFELMKKLRKLGATIIILSHTTKEKDVAGKEFQFRGLNIIKDNTDNMFFLTRENNTKYLYKREKSRADIKEFIEAKYNHDNVYIESFGDLDSKEFYVMTQQEKDKMFISEVQALLRTNGVMEKKAIVDSLKESDFFLDIGINKLRDKIDLYTDKYWKMELSGERKQKHSYRIIDVTQQYIDDINVFINNSKSHKG